MKILISFLLVLNTYASDLSLALPLFERAIESIVLSQKDKNETVGKIKNLILNSGVKKEFLKKLYSQLQYKSNDRFFLPVDDHADELIKENLKESCFLMEDIPVAIHAHKFDVIEDEDDLFDDDIFVYFIVTDGVIPSGFVTSIYKGLDQGTSFLFMPKDRGVFPLGSMSRRIPQGNLIVDYGIVESDQDDISELQKISSVIIDAALIAYATAKPQQAAILIKLRKEIKHMTEILLSLENDDRLAIGNIIMEKGQSKDFFKDKDMVVMTKEHKGTHQWSDWFYKITFRIFK